MSRRSRPLVAATPMAEHILALARPHVPIEATTDVEVAKAVLLMAVLAWNRGLSASSADPELLDWIDHEFGEEWVEVVADMLERRRTEFAREPHRAGGLRLQKRLYEIRVHVDVDLS